MDFEKNIKRLEEIVTKMERGDLALEDSLKLFEEGVGLSRDCQKRLSEAEVQVKKLTGIAADGSLETEDFQSEDSE